MKHLRHILFLLSLLTLSLLLTVGCQNTDLLSQEDSAGGRTTDESSGAGGDSASGRTTDEGSGGGDFTGAPDPAISEDGDLIVDSDDEDFEESEDSDDSVDDEPIYRAQPNGLIAGDWDDNLNYNHYLEYIEDFAANPFVQTQGFEFAFQDKVFNDQATQLDVVFVLDTTGSMGDELEYLKDEVEQIISDVALEYNNLSIHTGAVLYRDHGDDYLTRTIDFHASVNDFKGELDSVRAGGGGDFPEAVHKGLEAALDMQFRPNATKLVFLMADAPTHANEHIELLQQTLRAQEAGVTIYPIASSGVDLMAEFLFRMMAQQTAGRYVFLTDDSGIGNSHAEPTIPCYFVRNLNRLLSDIMIYELEGEYRRPDELEIIRASGNPDDEGRCMINEEEFFVTC